MENSEKQLFEKSWREAFREAEQNPSEQVWMGVEHALDAAEAGVMRRNVVFYKRLAAAAILFALAIGGLTTYYVIDEQRQAGEIASKDNEVINKESSTGNNIGSHQQLSKKDQVKHPSKIDATVTAADENINSNIPSVKTVTDHPVMKHESPAFIAQDDSGNPSLLKNQREISFASHLSSLAEPEIKLKGKMREVTLARKLPAMPASFMAESGNKRSPQENLWAALGASVGNYTPTSNLRSSDVMESAFKYQAQNLADPIQVASSSSSSRGSMVSFGMNMGKRVSDRWLLQGGVSYFTQSIGYTSNYAVLDANNRQTANVASYGSLKSYAIVPTATPYQVNSVNQFISVPLQAGYMIINRKIGWQLNSGVATDLFFQNTMSDKSGQLASYSSGPGEDSPYRTVSWAGLMGTELSYKMGDQYRFSVAPGLRYSISSVLKSDSYNPLVWDVGFRFRYIIK